MSNEPAGYRRDRIGIGIVVAGLHVATIGFLLMVPLVVPAPRADESLVVITVREPVDEPEPAKGKMQVAPKAGRKTAAVQTPIKAATPADATMNMAATSPVDRAALSSIAAAPAPVSGVGSSTSGRGAGHAGDGVGIGGNGTPPRWVAGRIQDSDYPRTASRLRAGGTVIVHFDVLTNGTVANCRIASSSGNVDLDRTTCTLVEKRFRYAPARDATGRPVTDIAGWQQAWWLEPRN